MTRYVLAALAVTTAMSPASAAIRVIATNVDFSAAPFTFGITPADTFTFTYSPQGSFDPSPVLISTSGTAQVQVFFGAPSVSFSDPPAIFGPNAFPGYGSVPTATRAAYTLTSSDLGLRYAVGSTYYYGYARFANSVIQSVAFETTPNTGVIGGAVPEPATWLMMLTGFGLVGAGMRRRKVAVSFS